MVNERRIVSRRLGAFALILMVATLAPPASALAAFDSKPGSKPEPTAKSTPFEDALHQAENNLKTPAGERYDFIVGQQFARNYEMVMMGCTESAAQQDLAPFDLVMQLKRNGTVQQVLVNPSTSVARCLAPHVARGKFKKPPKRRYWVHISMNLSP
jgi:hypothetical protein